MKLRYIIIGFYLIILFSCNNDNRNMTVDIVTRFINKELIVPDTIDMFMFDKCLKNNDMPHKNKLSIITYVNGNCGKCVEQMFLWDEYMNKNNLKDSISLLIFVNAFDYSIFEYHTEEAKFKYPVFHDRSNYFFISNNLPEKNHFQTFLVDSNNLVQAIGNPIINSNISDLYLKIIQKTK